MIRTAKYHGCKCYFDDETNELQGRNWLWDWLVSINLWLDLNVFGLEELPVWIDLTDEEVADLKKKQPELFDNNK